MPTEFITTNIVNLAVLTTIGLASWGVRRIYAGLPADKQQILANLANMIVPAIEQGSTNLADPARKIQAVNKVRDMLSVLGIKNISDSMISTAIEAALFAMKQQTSNSTDESQKLLSSQS